MNYNYHTHTPLCAHASGTPEEYIINAMKNGMEYMGFSDHIPFICVNGNQSGYRVPYDTGKIYCEEIKKLALKYKDKIDIKVGFEMEYYPENFEEMLKSAREFGAEYLILGEHFVCDESINGHYSSRENEDFDLLKAYVDNVCDAIKSGVFSYVAHPDMFNFVGDNEIYREQMRRICKASKEYDIPLEFNFLGIRTNRIYPNKKFLKIAAEEKSPIVFGLDAHSTEDSYDGESFKKAMELVNELGLNYIGRPKIISIK